MTIKPIHKVDYLQRLIDETDLPPTDETPKNGEVCDPNNQCPTVLPTSSRQKSCLAVELHKVNGEYVKGPIESKACNVKFIKITPKDLTDCPYVMVVSTGVHNHPPTPPLTIPTYVWT
ncbi:hypothetical protein DFS34DRAFT_221122 [Phlyctochytrium arcticum]|nr:hypothetical protein DFS34DRAFT_221122 [Phlyctochytrium arcticum]